MRLMRFNAKAEYMPGRNMVVADALSRSPLNTIEDFMSAEVSAHVNAIVEGLPVSQQKLAEIQRETQKDERMVEKFVKEGWPECGKSVPNSIQRFYKWKDFLSVSDGLLVMGNRIVIPKAMQQSILSRIHEGHQGLSKCRARAKETVWWPGISEDLRQKTETCKFCIEKWTHTAERAATVNPFTRKAVAANSLRLMHASRETVFGSFRLLFAILGDSTIRCNNVRVCHTQAQSYIREVWHTGSSSQ